ncbi:hypothetical protein [Photobacterium indicum]|uniref:Uncharacterized protein n=1 Tax=Photobacterium indicum TaxID=81447 RepID=A0A2T3LER8_9GAMM|nr:hypothetical protein [Photobacterium indicum]PSV49848.1 hypothetical protein C9J47_04670 [Photobacterium indicum]
MLENSIKESAEAVEVALATVKLEMENMNRYCASQAEVIRSLISNGETFQRANEISSDILNGHIERNVEAYKNWLELNRKLKELLNEK